MKTKEKVREGEVFSQCGPGSSSVSRSHVRNAASQAPLPLPHPVPNESMSLNQPSHDCHVPPSSGSLQETGFLTLDALEPKGSGNRWLPLPGAEPGVGRAQGCAFSTRAQAWHIPTLIWICPGTRLGCTLVTRGRLDPPPRDPHQTVIMMRPERQFENHWPGPEAPDSSSFQTTSPENTPGTSRRGQEPLPRHAWERKRLAAQHMGGYTHSTRALFSNNGSVS